VTCGQAGGGVRDPRRTEKDRIEADFVENEANFRESVIISERHDFVEVVANSEAPAGLDKKENEANSEPLPAVVNGGEAGGQAGDGVGDARGTETAGDEAVDLCRREAEAAHTSSGLTRHSKGQSGMAPEVAATACGQCLEA
jgi:hypothetical protein